MLKVAAFTGGLNDPSARFRLRQYIPILKKQDIEVTDFYSKVGKYPPRNKLMRPLWAFVTLSMRIPDILKSYNYNITVLQREMLSTFKTFELFTKSPRILDVDDAIWLHKDGKFINMIAANCDAVICGNKYIADYFSKINNSIYILPTGVDINRYKSINTKNTTIKNIIGWMGTSGGFKYLYKIEKAISIILKKYSNAKLRVVSDRMPKFSLIKNNQLEFIKWSSEIEIKSLQDILVGIMPLEDSLWERGKCSYKMLLYMACEKPTIVSPVGMNNDILLQGNVGLKAKTIDDWVECFEILLTKPKLAAKMGREGRKVVIENYSLQKLSNEFSKILFKFAN